MIYTSYFSKIKQLQNDGIIPISIALSNPKWYSGLEYKVLAPTWSILKKYKDDYNIDDYVEQYNIQILSRLDPTKVYCELLQISGNEDFAMICYEKPADFCHRHLVAEWLHRYGFEVNEYGNCT